MSNSLQPHGLQHARFPCPSLSPRVCSNSCPLNQWCYLTITFISSSAASFSCPQSFPGSGSFPMSQFLASGGQSIGTSASASVLQMNIQGWFPVGLTGLICCLRDSQKSSPTPQFESISSSVLSLENPMEGMKEKETQFKVDNGVLMLNNMCFILLS